MFTFILVKYTVLQSLFSMNHKTKCSIYVKMFIQKMLSIQNVFFGNNRRFI